MSTVDTSAAEGDTALGDTEGVAGGALRDRAVLVTGATGFVGSRLARWLATAEGARVRGCGRKVDRVANLREVGVDIVSADLLDGEAMAAAVAGQSIVFHVGAWTGGSRHNPESSQAINVDATIQLVRLAAEAGVERFVHVSSIAAYGPPEDGDVLAETPLDPTASNDEYGRTKAQGEQGAFAAAAEHDLAITAIRPGQIYGPGSWTWTAGMAKLVKKGVPTILGPGDGHAAPVFVDDVIRMLVRCAVADGAVGRAFNCVSGAVPWTEFFAPYGRMTGRSPRRVPMAIARVLAAVNETVHIGLPINRARLQYYKAKPVYRTDDARTLLGWEPTVDLDEGMQRSEAWLREIGRI